MATWDLPVPDGPRWPDPLAGAGSDRPGRAVLDTPWHFPLREEDGLGPFVRREHDRLAREREVEDLMRSPETYGRLLEVDHWERVLRARDLDRRRPRGFVTAIENVLADLLGLQRETVQRLRKLLSARKAGRLRGLPRRG